MRVDIKTNLTDRLVGSIGWCGDDIMNLWVSNPRVKQGDLLRNSGWQRRVKRKLPNVGLEPHRTVEQGDLVRTHVYSIAF